MRVVKFRAWDKEIEKIYPVLKIDFVEEWVSMYSKIAGRHYNWLNNLVLMQYTGLEDKNGVEIYESYIVKFDPQSPCGDEFYNPRDGEIGEVIFDFGSLVVRPIDKKRESLRFSLSGLGDWVVVGNIYENPELLQ
jgi:hypothetical protein